jgi:alpha/beta superfamily hydrolase
VGLRAGADDPRVHRLIGVALPVARRDASFLLGVKKPTLLICGDRDDVAPLDRIQALHSAMPGPKALSVIPGANHFFLGQASSVGETAAAFLMGTERH